MFTEVLSTLMAFARLGKRADSPCQPRDMKDSEKCFLDSHRQKQNKQFSCCVFCVVLSNILLLLLYQASR